MDSKSYRGLIGHFATGVTVLTTERDGWLHGMTANAVTSVSLEPILLLACVDRDAACHGEIVAAGRFGVNILAADQQAISNLFAAKSEPEQGTLKGAAFRIGSHGTPILDGCVAHLECRLEETLAGGDHDIFIGEVMDGAVDRGDAAPLLFFQGRYRLLGE